MSTKCLGYLRILTGLRCGTFQNSSNLPWLIMSLQLCLTFVNMERGGGKEQGFSAGTSILRSCTAWIGNAKVVTASARNRISCTFSLPARPPRES
eukprot:14728495-Heterocapsa_arctica.AAC.1